MTEAQITLDAQRLVRFIKNECYSDVCFHCRGEGRCACIACRGPCAACNSRRAGMIENKILKMAEERKVEPETYQQMIYREIQNLEEK